MCFFTFLHLWQPEFIWNSRFITKVNSVSPFVTLAHGGLLGVVVCMHVCFNINQVVVVFIRVGKKELEQIFPLKMLTVVLTKLFAHFI